MEYPLRKSHRYQAATADYPVEFDDVDVESIFWFDATGYQSFYHLHQLDCVNKSFCY